MTSKKWLDRGIYSLSIVISRLINRGKSPNNLIFNNILCIKEDEIGDLVNAFPVFEMLKKQYPTAKLTVLCRPFGLQLLKYSPFVDQIVTDYNQLESRYDLMIDLRGTIRSTLLALKKPPLYRLDRGTVRFKNRKKGAHPHEAETNWNIIRPVIDDKNKTIQPQLYLSVKERSEATQFLSDRGIKNFAVFHTGARRILKKWPLDRVAEIMKWLHHEYKLDCVLAGDKIDAEDALVLQQNLDFPLHIAAGQINLLVFAALCEKASLFIGNDSGPLHIASTMGTSSIGLFGPGDPIFHPQQSNATFIHHILECNPCDQVHCKYSNNPCIKRITIDEVKEKAIELWRK